MSTPSEFYSNAINLNRYSNSVAKRIINAYNDLVVDAIEQLRGLDDLAAPDKAARLRSILAQLKSNVGRWANESVSLSIEELEELAGVEAGFVAAELRKALPAELRDTVKPVVISPNFAEAVVTVDPTQRGIVSLSDDLQAAVTGAGTGVRLTIAEGVTLTLPNGQVLQKSFRDLGEKQTALFGQAVRNGLLQGETTDSIVKRLKGRLRQGQPGSINQVIAAGGQATIPADNQIRTLVRTSINQVANAAIQKVFEANQDVTKQYKYVATLDGRTSAICRALDGTVHDYGKGPLPPQHFNCRSATVPIIDYKGLGIPEPEEDERSSASGLVPEGTTYGRWLANQTAAERQRILGSRASYFDYLTEQVGPEDAIRKFVRQDGSELTLDQLKRRYPDASPS
jgi:SPP1 gp7 family putative phage head morphogenesis protein|tara:strand:+ start:266 stop:1459 length:1194 start_codon:yes stop_codon:yes gene_type:complete